MVLPREVVRNFAGSNEVVTAPQFFFPTWSAQDALSG